MEGFEGKILDGEKVVLECVEGQLEHIDSPDGPKSWRGSFQTSDERMLESDKEYKLLLSDGRSGQIGIRRRKAGTLLGDKVRYQFVGSGPLK